MKTFEEVGDDMLMGFKGGGLRLKESKILPALAGWRGVGGRRLMAKFKKNSILLDSSPKRQVRDRQNCHLNICSCIG